MDSDDDVGYLSGSSIASSTKRPVRTKKAPEKITYDINVKKAKTKKVARKPTPVPAPKKKKQTKIAPPKEDTVQYLSNHWFVNNLWHYEVHWKGWHVEDRTYEPHKNLTNCLELLADYYKKYFGSVTEADVIHCSDLLKSEVVPLEDNDISDFLAANMLTVSKDLLESNLDQLEDKLCKDLHCVAECVARMGKCEGAPQDGELRGRGSTVATLLSLIPRRREQLRLLKQKERELNEIEEAEIVIENNEDFQLFPTFHYTTKMIVGKDVQVEDTPVVYCLCTDDCSDKKICNCAVLHTSAKPYNSNGELYNGTSGIYECNKMCKCPPTCKRRVVQHGRKIPLCIYKTKDIGWAVKSINKIAKGTYLCEYLGELITEDESQSRDPVYTTNRQNYIFNLDFNDEPEDANNSNGSEDSKNYCVDATQCGNFSRLINHSCDPNAEVQAVWVDTQNPQMHKLCFFSTKCIRPGEQIRFDYSANKTGSASEPVAKDTFCQCGADNCRKFIFTKGIENDDDGAPASEGSPFFPISPKRTTPKKLMVELKNLNLPPPTVTTLNFGNF